METSEKRVFESEPFYAVEPYYDPTDMLRSKEEFFCEMSRDDHGFLSGLLRDKRPKKILEVGVANGGTTLMIMKTLQMLGLKSEVVSVDLNKYWYHDNTKETGFLCKQMDECNLGGDIGFI